MSSRCSNRAHQTHYEQFGKLSGIVNIEEFGQLELNVIGVRDHSYGMFILTSLCSLAVDWTDKDNVECYL